MSRVCGFTLVILLLSTSTALAHAIGVQAKRTGETVAIEGYYDDNTPTAEAIVTVSAADGSVIAEGKTDAKGVWNFPAPRPGKYRVRLDAGDGHRATTHITIASADAKSDTDEQPIRSAMTDHPVSESVPREQFTQRPWERIGLGLGGIGIVTLLLRGIGGKNRRKSADTDAA